MFENRYKSFTLHVRILLGFSIFITGIAFAQPSDWIGLGPYTTGTIPTKRHENAFIEFEEKMYLIGGRETSGVQAYDPTTNTWENKTAAPVSMHHMQPVIFQNKIYILGAASDEASFPNEPPHTNIWIYDPIADNWEEGPVIPPDRNMASAGVVVFDDKLYMACGSVKAHDNDGTALFTEYDPATNTWTPFPDAPRARDHVQAALVGNLLILGAGRQTPLGDFAQNTVEEIDIYDLSQGVNGTWTTLPANANIPTPRSAPAVVVVGNEVIYMGGESARNPRTPHLEVEALDIVNQTWRNLANLIEGRHATQANIFDGKIFMAAGSQSNGGDTIVDPSQDIFVVSLELEQAPPNAIITADPIIGDAPLTVNFGSAQSSDPDGTIATYVWDFGDGNSSTDANPSHTYDEVGVYTVTLIITDNDGLTDQATSTVNVTVPGGINVLLIGESIQGDLDIQQRLEATGATVDIIAGAAAQSTDEVGYDVILISSSVISTEVADKFTNATIPVINWEPFIFDDLGMTGPVADTDFGIIPQNQIDILLPDHPLAGGFTGTVTATTAQTDMSWGQPSANAVIVGVNPTIPAQSFIFGYEAGVEMVGINAEARRVGLFLMDDTPGVLTEDGWALLIAAVSWAASDPTLLPIEWGFFEAEVNLENQVELNWSTITEENSSHFVVHRADDSGYFFPLAQLSTAQNSSKSQYYNFVDTEPTSGTNYYRLQHVDIDGSYSFSPIVEAYLSLEVPHLYPNPVALHSELYIRGEYIGKMQVSLIDMQGKLVFQENWNNVGTESHTIKVNEMNPGIYIAIIESSRGVMRRKVVVEP